MALDEDLGKILQIPIQYNEKLQLIEMQYDTEIKNKIDSLPEPFHTYYKKVKKWSSFHPEADVSKFHIPKGIMQSITKIKSKMMRLKIGGLKEDYGYSSGLKFDMGPVIQAIASGKGLTSKSRPFIRVTSDIQHSITILIDFSSSMKPYHEKVRESVYIFSEVISQLQLPFAIFGYSENFWIIKDFSDKWNIETKARLFSIEPKGMSPAGIAIDIASHFTQKVSEKGKILFVISDGLFDNRKLVRLSVSNARKLGIILIGISTCFNIDDLFPIAIVETENLNTIWSRDSFMRLYSKEFQSVY